MKHSLAALALLVPGALFAEDGLLRSRGAPAAWCWQAPTGEEAIAHDAEPAADGEESGVAASLPENCDVGGAAAIGAYASKLFPGRAWTANLLGGLRTVGLGLALSPAKPVEEGEPARWMIGFAFVVPWEDLGGEMQFTPAVFVAAHF